MSDSVSCLATFEKTTKAAAEISLLRLDADRAEILEKFWMLHDGILQLADSVSDRPKEAAELMANQYKPLVQQIVDTLSFARVRKFADIPAVNQACDHIHSQLSEIKRLTDGSKAAGAP
jgi:hypothetical protein